MSLCQLPAELDARIIDYLADDKNTLSAISKVSKYYRSVVKPFLYTNLAFRGDDWDSLTLFLLTLVRREQLGLYVKSLKVDDDSCLTPTIPLDSAVGTKLFAEASLVHAKINEIVQSLLSGINNEDSKRVRKFFARMLGDLLSERCRIPALSLILALVPNLEQLYLCDPARWLTLPREDFMSLPWAQTQPRFLEHLQTYSVRGAYEPRRGIANSDLPPPMILPSMTELRISRCGFGQPGRYYNNYEDQTFNNPTAMPSAQDKRIQTLILTKTCVTPEFIIIFIKNAWFSNLKELRVTNNANDQDENTFAREIQRLVRKLERYTPGLEVFEWSSQRYDGIPPVYSTTFKNLKNLRELYIDVNLIVSIVNPDLRVLHDASWLPSNLRQLTFDNVTRQGLEHAVGLIYERNTDARNTNEMIAHAFTSLAVDILPRNLEVRIKINEHGEIHPQELMARTVCFLHSVADALEPYGIRLQVRHNCWHSGEDWKLAIAPGYTA